MSGKKPKQPKDVMSETSLNEFVNKQKQLISSGLQQEAVKELNIIFKKYQNDKQILDTLIKTFEEEGKRQNLSDYERHTSNIYVDNLKEVKNKKTLKIKYKNPPTQEEFEKSKGEKVEAEVKPEPAKEETSTAQPAPPAKQPPAQEPAQPPAQPAKGKGKTKKQQKPNLIKNAFDVLISDDPQSFRDFIDVLEKGKETKNKDITKDHLLSLKNDLGFVGSKSNTKAQLVDKIRDAVVKYAIDNNLDNIVDAWEQTYGQITAEKAKQELLKDPTKAQELEEGIKAKKAKDLTPEEVSKLTPEQQEQAKAEAEQAEKDISDFILEKFRQTQNEKLAQSLIQYDPNTNVINIKKIDFTPKQVKKNGFGVIQDSLVKSLLNEVYLKQYNDIVEREKNNEAFKQKTPEAKAEYVKSLIKTEITPEELNKVFEQDIFNQFFTIYYNYIFQDNKDKIDLNDFNKALGELKNLSEPELLQLKEEIKLHNNEVVKYGETEYKSIVEEMNKPAVISQLPPMIKPSQIKEEDLLSALDKYNKLKTEITQEQKASNYESLKLRSNMGDPTLTQAEKDAITAIENKQQALKKLEPDAKSEQQKKASSIAKSSIASKRTGFIRPHFKNDTEKAVQNAIGETVEQQIEDIKNWYIFDIPIDQTGVGNKYDNPLVKQNEQRQNMLFTGVDLFTSQTPFLVEDGVDERKDFYNSSFNSLTKESINRGLYKISVEEEEKQFLQKFNDGSNGLFTAQGQTKQEQNDFKNIYQTPPDHYLPQGIYTGDKHPLQYTNNNGITHTDRVWINNLNLFYDNAPMV